MFYSCHRPLSGLGTNVYPHSLFFFGRYSWEALGLQVSQCQNEIDGCVKKSPIDNVGYQF